MQTLKSLLITMIILGGVYLAYDYYLAPDANKIVFKKAAPEKTVPHPLLPQPEVNPVQTAMPPAPAPLPATPPPPVAPPEPVPASPPPPPVVTDTFAPPVIPDVIQATQNWTRIPSSAFPRVVKLNKPVTFKANFGSTQLAAGSEVTAVAAQNNMLTVSPNAASTLRGTVEIDHTNLKAVLTGLYDAWRVKRLEHARYVWAQRKDMPAPVPEVEKAVAVAEDGKPLMKTDGTYPLLLASMKAGQVTEITPYNIKKWGRAQLGEFKGQKCWDVDVDFEAATAFGKFSTTAVAKVVNGSVAHWVYQGSGESVP